MEYIYICIFGKLVLKLEKNLYLGKYSPIAQMFQIFVIFQVDNYSHLFGFIFGFLLSFMVLPYVSVGKFDSRRKIITIVVCFLCFVGNVDS